MMAWFIQSFSHLTDPSHRIGNNTMRWWKTSKRKSWGRGTKASYPVGFAQGLWSKLTSPISVSGAEGHLRLLSPMSSSVRHRGRWFAWPQITPSAEDRLSVSLAPCHCPKDNVLVLLQMKLMKSRALAGRPSPLRVLKEHDPGNWVVT